MQRIGQGMTLYHNEKYDQQGTIFQSAYHSRTIRDDEYLRYVTVYVMVKNVFELFPNGGLAGATTNFEEAWKWAEQYPFSSFPEYAGVRTFPLTDDALSAEIFPSIAELKTFSQDVIAGGKWLQAEFE